MKSQNIFSRINYKKFLSLILDVSILLPLLLFFSSAGFQDKNTSGWTLQILPNLNGAQISDVTFTDSLTGYFATNNINGTAFIYKTTNGGDNWVMKKTSLYAFTRIIFCDKNIGYSNSFNTLYKTTNSGENWDSIPLPGIYGDDMSVLNKDTLWLAMSEGLTGGLFRTTNGGLSWTSQIFQYQWGNPDKIYMVNKNLGFLSRGNYEGRTTNGGLNWTIQTGDTTFRYMKFVDSLTGWRAFENIKKTTDGGLTWFTQTLPKVAGSIYNGTGILRFSIINKDTIFGVGGWFDYPNNQSRCVIYKTTNGGLNWGYQIPDTSFNIFQLRHVCFSDKNNGWAFGNAFGSGYKFIRTLTGGADTTFYTSINNNNNQIVSTDFVLEQNYPNPFNASTIINYKLAKAGQIRIKVYDITGKEIAEIVNKVLQPGIYQTRFDGANFSSGVYLYKLEVIDRNSNNVFIETKRMLLIK